MLARRPANIPFHELTRISIKVKVLARVAMTLVLESGLLRGWAVSERNMPVSKVLEEVDLLLGE
jgi:hypothetical protein